MLFATLPVLSGCEFPVRSLHPFYADENLIEPALRLSFPDQDWLLKLLKENPGAIRHEALGSSDLILTASTDALQRFWLEYPGNEDAFIESIYLQRIKDSTD